MSHPVYSWTLLPDDPAPNSSGGGTFTPGIDLLLDNDGDLVIGSDLQFTTGLTAVAQGIRQRVQMFKGEWFADLDAGMPWFQDILGQKYSSTKVRDAFRRAILSTPEVDSLEKLEVEFNRSNRTVTVDWEAKSDYGTVIDGVTQ